MTAVRVLQWCLVVLGLLIPLALRAQTAQVLPAAEEIIVRADALGANRQFDRAVELLQTGLERYPTYGRLYLALAIWQERQGIFATQPELPFDERKSAFRAALAGGQTATAARAVFDTLGMGTMFADEARDLKAYAAELTLSDFPGKLGEYGPIVLPGDPTAFTYSLTDPRLPAEARGTYQGLITMRPLRVAPAFVRDPKYGKGEGGVNNARRDWTFQWMLYAYAFNHTSREWELRFRVMWQDVPGSGGARRIELAQQTAQLLIRLSTLLQVYAGLEPRFNHVVNVWLAENGEAGGESFNESIYLQEVGTPRSPAEWIRELAHEYGHQTFPAVGGYDKPEWAANGYLGERVFLRWLTRNPTPQLDPHPWVRALNPADVRTLRVDRYLRQFLAAGPTADVLRGKDATAMDAFTGLALYLESARDGRVLAEPMLKMTTPTFGADKGFFSWLEELDQRQLQAPGAGVTYRVDELPRDLPVWVYLTESTWKGELQYGADTPIKAQVEIDDKPVQVDELGAFATPMLKTGWHRVKYTLEGTPPPTVQAISFVKQ